MAKKLTHEEFIQKWESSVKNPSYTIVGKYVNSRTPILIKDEYGECLVKTGNLLRGAKPSIETSVDKTYYWINQARKVHGDLYDYSKVNFNNSRSNIEIVCKKHGSFKQTPDAHLAGKVVKNVKGILGLIIED